MSGRQDGKGRGKVDWQNTEERRYRKGSGKEEQGKAKKHSREVADGQTGRGGQKIKERLSVEKSWMMTERRNNDEKHNE